LTGCVRAASTVAVATVFAAAVAYAQTYKSAPAAAPQAYLGSQACEGCHPDEFTSWRRALHVQMTKPIAEARVEGDFSAGTRLEQNGRAYTMEAKDGRYAISVAHDGRPAEKFQVDYTLGARRFQGYLSKLPDGRIYVLPVFWHNETKRWLDWKEIAPVPDHPAQDLRQIWNITCVNCHATNLAKNFNPATRTYDTRWTEMGIGCEACHGPGAAHVAIATEWDKDPLRAPTRPSMDELKIFAPPKAGARQNFDACGYCHGNKNNAFFGFVPGDRYEDYALPFLISEPIPDNDPQGDFWPDGRPSRFNRPQALTLTGCFQRGEATCTNCHRMHGPGNAHMLKVPVETADGQRTRESDSLCTQCHVEPGKAVKGSELGRAGGPGGADRAGRSGSSDPGAADAWSAHTHHAPGSQGSRCVECHMSDVNWRLFTRRRDHTFQPPVPELTASYGVPNACTTCHEDRSPEWAAGTIDRWYGNGARRRAVLSMSDTIYRAGTGDANVLPDIARLAADRSHGSLIRASAAEFAGQLLAKPRSQPPGADVVNPLIGAANDPEPLVRAAAVRSLGAVVDDRTSAVIAARLSDPARVVRVRAAEALLDRHIIQLDGAVGAALSRAQDEWAESLRTFNDVAHDQTMLGWLELSRGNVPTAVEALNAALAIDPSRAQPHVYLGVIAARAGRYDDALKQFTTAKSLQPAYPNLDKLIEEARSRAGERKDR
jgi:tetratricopeptide repeat protein/HEAT repeat protein/doubled CXXCH motif protein/cytochrome c554/c'-like protein